MFVLDSTQKITAKLAGAIATDQPEFAVSFADWTTSALTPGANANELNSTTDVDVVASPAVSTSRLVKTITFNNKDSASVTIIVEFDDNGTKRKLCEEVVGTTRSLVYSDGEFHVGNTTEYTHPNHTGDVTSVSDGATTISANAVVNTMLADMVQDTIKGRTSGGGTGDPVDLTPAAVRTILDISDHDVTGLKNLLINGNMSIAQRTTSQSGATGSQYQMDRFKNELSNIGTYTLSQDSTDFPDGFGFSHKIECTTANASPASTDYHTLTQRLMGVDLQHLKRGLSGAVKLTLSFWVKSNKTGIYTAELVDIDNNRHSSFGFTVTSSWTRVEITFDGDTDAGAVLDNNFGHSFHFYIWLSAGSNYAGGSHVEGWDTTQDARVHDSQVIFSDSNTNVFHVTGIQLEVGEVATDFEHILDNLNRVHCFRYYEEFNISQDYTIPSGGSGGTTDLYRAYSYSSRMRATPTVTGSNIRYYSSGSGTSVTPDAFVANASSVSVRSSGLTNGRGYVSGTLKCDAEL